MSNVEKDFYKPTRIPDLEQSSRDRKRTKAKAKDAANDWPDM